jgi:hypothetical protein
MQVYMILQILEATRSLLLEHYKYSIIFTILKFVLLMEK